jgi:PAS domain S-box-containing protein
MTPEDRNDDLYRRIFDEIAVGLAQVDVATGRFTRVNRKYCEITGYAREELRQMNYRTITHPEDTGIGLAEMQLLKVGKIREFTMEKRYVRKDGGVVWVRLTVSPITGEDALVTQHIAVVIDITRQKQEQEWFRENEARFNQLVEAISDGVFITDAEGTVAFANPALARMHGFEHPSQLMGRRIQEFIPPDALPETWACFREVVAGHPLVTLNVPILRPDGTRVVFEIRAAPRYTGGKIAGTQGIARDITERMRAEAALQETLRAKTEFIHNITHELRTPLNVVIGFAEMLKAGVPGPLNPQQTEYAADILASGERLLALVNGILDMAQLDEPDAASTAEPVAIGALLAEWVAAHASAVEARHVKIDLAPVGDAGSVALDPEVFKRMIAPLLDNAIKFNREGGAVTVRARRDRSCLEIAITDTGIGIARMDLPRLFKPMIQLDAGAARRYGGIGLGLALAQRQARILGGGIIVVSTRGEGSTFTLTLPFEKERT